MVDLHAACSNKTTYKKLHFLTLPQFRIFKSWLQCKMTTGDSVEDLESGAGANGQIEAELKRIKENYRTTVIVPELPGAYIPFKIL